VTARVDASAGCALIVTRDGSSEWQFVDDPASQGAAFVIRPTGLGSGLGAFATRAIKRGECILSEAPLVKWTLHVGEKTTASLVSLVNALRPDEYATYCGLCQNPMHGKSGSKSVYGIWLSNAYPCISPFQAARSRQSGMDEDEIENTKAVFASACRFNHSCSPNAHVAWNAPQGHQAIHALCNIAEGAEIGVSYLDNASGTRRAQRHEELGFACTCSTCKLSGALLAASDQRRSRIGVIFGVLEAAARSANQRTIALVSERLELMEEEELLETWNTLFVAASFCGITGDAKQASRWAARAAESAKHGLGAESDEYAYYAEHATPRRWREASQSSKQQKS